MSYYASIYANVEQDPLTLSGSHRPGIRDQEPSDSHQFASLQSICATGLADTLRAKREHFSCTYTSRCYYYRKTAFLATPTPQAADTASRPKNKEDNDQAEARPTDLPPAATDQPVNQTLGSKAKKQSRTFVTNPNSADQEGTTSTANNKRLTLAAFFTGNTYDAHRQVEFNINKLQPFMYFPIGTSTESQDKLRGLYDTGGCCNMGWLQYHLEIAKRFPNVVKQVINLENRREEPFSIGGIDGSVLVTHIIEYYIPYRNTQGEQFCLQIGLVDDLPINTLFGLPFIIKAQLILNLHRMAVTSDILQDEFETKMERNTRTPIEDITHTHDNNAKIFAARRSTLPPVL